jgi:hypothetical protein
MNIQCYIGYSPLVGCSEIFERAWNVIRFGRMVGEWRVHGRLKPIFTQTLVVSGFDKQK